MGRWEKGRYRPDETDEEEWRATVEARRQSRAAHSSIPVQVWPPIDIGRTTTMAEERDIARDAPHGAILETYEKRSTAEEHLKDLTEAGIPARIVSGPSVYLTEAKIQRKRLGIIPPPEKLYHVVKGRKGPLFIDLRRRPIRMQRRHPVRVHSYRRRR